MGIGYKVVWVRGGMGRGHHADNALFVGVCAVLLGGWGGHDHASNVAPAEKYL